MARIRTVKPEFFQDEDLIASETKHELPHLMLVYAGLWTQADRRGLFAWSEFTLALNILPGRPIQTFRACMEALVEDGFVVRYSLNDHTYGYIPTLQRHQLFNIRERPNTAIPQPDTNPTPTQNGVEHVGIGSGPGSGKEGKGSEGKGSEGKPDLSLSNRRGGADRPKTLNEDDFKAMGGSQ